MLALLLEAEVSGQMTALVIASEQEKGVGVVDFEGPKVKDAFDAKVTAVDIVAQEEVLRRCRVASHFE